MATHWLGPYANKLEDGNAYRGLPDGCSYSVPLGFVAGVPWGIFTKTTPGNLDVSYRQFGSGDPREVSLRAVDKAAWTSALGIPSSQNDDTLADLIWDTLTRNTDPLGLDAPKPIVSRRSGVRELWLAKTRIRQAGVSIRTDSNLRDVVRDSYRRAKAEVDAGQSAENHHLRVLDWLGLKYLGRNYSLADLRTILVPPDMDQDVTPLPSGTTVSDDFNRSDGPVGANWTNEVNNALTITTNQAGISGGTNDNDLNRYSGGAVSGADALGTSIYGASTGTTVRCGPAVRLDTSANGYSVRYRQNNGEDVGFRWDAGSQTAIVTQTDSAATSGDTQELEIDGSTLTYKHNSTELWSTTDTTHSSGSYGGLHNYRGEQASDSWQYEDLAAATGRVWHLAGDRANATLSTPTTHRLRDI